jgi:hypothetical protein
MNRDNVTRLLTYLEQLKAEGAEDKWWMAEYLSDRESHEVCYPEDVTNWHCGTAGCFAGSWAIIRIKDGDEPPVSVSDIPDDFARDFGLGPVRKKHVVHGHWSPRGCYATLDEAIAYLRLCLDEDTMDVCLGS